MLRQAMIAILTNDRKLVAEISQKDNAVDRLHEAIKFYVVKVTRDSLDQPEANRAMEIMALSINLEHIGDILDKNLMELANKNANINCSFPMKAQWNWKRFTRSSSII